MDFRFNPRVQPASNYHLESYILLIATINAGHLLITKYCGIKKELLIEETGKNEFSATKPLKQCL
jgi:hypothetical protein